MRPKLFLLSLALCCAVLLGLPQVANANPVETFETFTFVGTCSTSCVGDSVATLVLKNYTLGTRLDNDNFVSFVYSSNDIAPVDITTAIFTRLAGQLGADGAYVVTVRDLNAAFQSKNTGNWCFGGRMCDTDGGSSNNWELVPEPGTASLVGLGLVGAGFVRRRFQR